MTELDFKNGYECVKLPWLYRNKPETEKIEEEEDSFEEKIISQNDFEIIKSKAEKYFVENHISVQKDFTLSFEGNSARIDFAVVSENKNLEIFKFGVTSETVHKKLLNNISLGELSYLAWIAQKNGYTVSKVSFLHLNRDYIKHGPLTYSEVFIVDDVTSQSLAMVDEVPHYIEQIQEELNKTTETSLAIEKKCLKCPFSENCNGVPSENSVLNLGWNFGNGFKDFNPKLELLKNGINTFTDILNVGYEKISSDINSKIDFKENPRRQIETYEKNLPPYCNKEMIKEELNKLRYPLYFLDFESFRNVIPEFDNSNPWQQIICQYSLHVIEKPEEEPKHFECLAKEGTDTRYEIIENLCRDITGDGSVIVYNKSFESKALVKFAELPDISEEQRTTLNRINSNIWDLMEIFRKQYYYQKEFGKSYSIKVVLPSFLNDPNLDYHKHFPEDAIHNGTEAQKAFADLVNCTPEQREKVRNDLLRYCEMDTLAEVLILKKLMKLVD